MSSSSQTLPKGPPPLPPPAPTDAPFAGPLRDEVAVDVEEAFFLEGIDGHADSLNEPEPTTIVLAPIGAGAPEDADGEQGDVEDPARTRRRRLARIGVGWGAALMMGVAGALAFMSPHGHERAPVALFTSPAPSPAPAAQLASASIAATPPERGSPAAEPVAVAASRSPVHPTTASTKAVGAAHPRSAAHKKGAAAPRGTKGSPASPKGSSPHAAQTHKPSTRAAASKPQRRGSTAMGASAKSSG